jgi:hypothetical protein
MPYTRSQKGKFKGKQAVEVSGSQSSVAED